MFCNKCGNQLKDGAKFCSKCGTPVEISEQQVVQDDDSDKTEIILPGNMPLQPVISNEPVANVNVSNLGTSKKDNGKKSSYKTLKGVVIGLCILLVFLGIGLALILRFSDEISYILYGESDKDDSSTSNTVISGSHRDDEDIDDEDIDDEDIEDEDLDDEADEADEIEEDTNLTADKKDLSDEPPVFQQFFISSKMDEDYDNVVDYTRYMRYDSGISEFCFGYPAELFHSVNYEDSMNQERYGLSEQEIHFSGNAGTELFYSLYKRTDNMNLVNMTKDVHDFEQSFITDPSDIVYKCEDNYGLCIISGYISNSRDYYFYNLTKIVDNYVMQMRVYYPVSSGDKGAYMIDTLYKMCGFSCSTEPAGDFNSFLNR